MILLLDTSTPVCKLTFVEGDWRYDSEWEAGRGLAKGLLGYLHQQLEGQGKTWQSLTGIVGYLGPGSYTGLRIGITVLNTLAYAEKLPIVGTVGEAWQQLGVDRLSRGENDQLLLPHYGGEAHITQPRK